MVPRLVGEGEGAEPPGCGSAVRGGHPESSRVSPCRTDRHLLQKAPLPLSPAAGAPPPVQGIALHPGFFWGANVPGRAEPSRGGCQNTPAPSFLHACPPPGAGSEFLGSPEFPRSQPMGGGAGRPLHSHRDRGWGGLFSCGGISCWGWRGPSSGGLSRYGAIICWLQLFSPLVTGPVWAAGHVLESPRVPGAIGEWGRCLSLSLHRG